VKRIRGPLPGMVLALCFHGPLVAFGLYRYSWDAATHMFFADHYRRSWFALWDPRWFGGFSVSSYPPLTHQLLALVSVPLGYDAAFGLVLLATLVLFPVGAWRFAEVFVSPRAATAAAMIAPLVPGVALASHAFGQLPTMVALTLALFLVGEFARFVERGSAIRLGSVVALSGTVFAAHHATALFLLAPALMAASATLLPGSAPRVRPIRLRRIILAAIGCGLAGAIVVLPFWLWARGGIPDAFIPHNSRSDFLRDLNAQALYLWGIYGLIPALAFYGFWRRHDRRTVAVAMLAGVVGVLGLGGTTPLPSLVFGRQWEWLTYDRFALWAAVAMLPLAGIAIGHLLTSRIPAGRVLAIASLAGILFYAGSDAVTSVLGPALPYQRDLQPIAQFMNNGRTAWRYQTFGAGDPGARLGTATLATTIDGTYYTARRVPVLARSGIGLLDSALWWDPSGAALRRALAVADQYSIRWAFVLDAHYDPYLSAAGFTPHPPLPGGIEVWENATAPRLPHAALRFGEPDAQGIIWGTLPLACFALVLLLAAVQSLAGRIESTRTRWTASMPARLPAQAVGSR
jgi:hypothetical protein